MEVLKFCSVIVGEMIKHRLVLSRSLLTLSLALGVVVSAFAQAEETTAFALEPQSLADALEAFSKKSGIAVATSGNTVAGKTAPPLLGNYTSKEALEILLSGSGLRFEFVSEDTVAIRTAASSLGGNVVQLQDVTITGQKLERSLLESPESLSVLGAQKLEQQPFQDIAGVIRELPNVTPIGESFSIRGVGATAASGTIAFVVDGVEVPSSFVSIYPKSLWDVEQLEVLRGPQSSSIGRNALNGAVVVKAKEPEFVKSAAIKAELGSEDARQGSLMVNTPLNDQHAVRFTFDYEEDSGFATAPNRGGEDSDAQSKLNSRFKWLFQPNEKLDTLLTLHYAERELGSDLVQNDPANGFSPFSQIDQSNRPPELEAEFLTFNFDVNYQLNEDLAFSSQTTYSDSKSKTERDGDFLPSDPDNGIDPFLTSNNESRDLTQEFQISIDNQDTGTKAVLGLFFDKNEIEGGSLSNASLSTTLLGIPQALISAGVYPSIINADSFSEGETDIDNYAIFFEVEKKISEQWTVFGGLRYDYEEQLRNTRTAASAAENTPALAFGGLPEEPYLPDPTVFGGLISPANPTAGAAQLAFINNLVRSRAISTETRDLETTFDALLPHFGVSYDWNEDHRSSAFFKQSYRPGGVQLLSTGINEYDAELLTSFEVSHRARFPDESLTLKTNLFYSIWDDRQVLDRIGFESVTLNAGKSKQYGLELEINRQVNERWSYFANFGYLQTEFIEFVDNGTDFSGNEFDYAPEFSGALGATYSFLHGWTIHMNTTYQSDTFRRLDNTTKNDEQFLANAQLSYQKENYEVNLSVQNLFDDDYITDNRGAGGLARIGDPITWRLSFMTRY